MLKVIMMKKIVYILMMSLMVLSSCDDYLDVIPKGKVIPETLEDYRLLLDQTHYYDGTEGLAYSYGFDVFYSNDLVVTENALNAYTRPAIQNAIMFKEHFYMDDEVDGNWYTCYHHIYKANVVIQQVMDATTGSEAEKAALLGEGYVHRAFAYWALVNLYAKHYDAATAGTDLGVPLRMQLDFEENLTRASVQEVYDQIKSDLLNAVDKMDAGPTPELNHRPNNAAAYGLLARVALYQKDLDNAIKYAEEALTNYSVMLDFNTLQPSWWAPGYLQLPMNQSNPEMTLLKLSHNAASTIYVSEELRDMMDPVDDLRSLAYLFPDDVFYPGSPDFLSAKFIGNTSNNGTSTAELYLIQAEAYAREGGVENREKAMQSINKIREMRFKTGSAYELTADNDQQALALVKAERRIELQFNGQRLFDIKRYRLWDNEQFSLTNTINGEDYVLDDDSPRWVFPIARKYINQNPEIEQNKR